MVRLFCDVTIPSNIVNSILPAIDNTLRGYYNIDRYYTPVRYIENEIVEQSGKKLS